MWDVGLENGTLKQLGLNILVVKDYLPGNLCEIILWQWMCSTTLIKLPIKMTTKIITYTLPCVSILNVVSISGFVMII